MKKFILGALCFTSTLVHSSEVVVLAEKEWKSEVKLAIEQKKNISNYWVEYTDSYYKKKITLPVFHMSLSKRDGDTELAKAIVNSGYDVTIQDEKGISALNHDCLGKIKKYPDIRRSVFEQILKGDKLDSHPINVTGCFGDSEIFEFIVNNKIKFDINQRAYGSPIFFQFFSGLPLNSFKQLMYLKPDFSLRDKQGDSIFHYLVAGSEFSKDKVAFLKTQGVNINARNSSSVTPLMKIVNSAEHTEESMLLENIELLIENGAIVRLKLKEYAGPHMEAGMNAIDIIKKDIAWRSETNKKKQKLEKVYRYLLEQDDIQRL